MPFLSGANQRLKEMKTDDSKVVAVDDTDLAPYNSDQVANINKVRSALEAAQAAFKEAMGGTFAPYLLATQAFPGMVPVDASGVDHEEEKIAEGQQRMILVNTNVGPYGAIALAGMVQETMSGHAVKKVSH